MNFYPWKGRNFGRPNDLNLPNRLLLVGESHYGASADDQNITTKVVEAYVLEGGLRFFTGALKAIMGTDAQATQDERASFYNAVAFYNFIQHMLESREDRPTQDNWQYATGAFPSCLDLVKPSHILVFGFGIWDYLPGERFSPSLQLERDVLTHLPSRYRNDDSHRDRGWIGRYGYAGGASLVMKIQHSSIAFSPVEWHPVLQWFLKLKE